MSDDKQITIFGDKSEVPAHIAGDKSGAGNENVSSEDMQIPRLNLLQAMSPAVEDIEGARPGLIQNSITDELFESLYVVNVHYDKEFTIFKDRNLGNEFLGNFPTREAAEAHLAAEKPGNEGDYNIIDTHRHAVIAIREDGTLIGPCLMLLSGAKLYFSRRWNTDIETRCADGKARFASVWHLTVTKDKNERGSWYNYRAAWEAWTPEELYAQAHDLYQSLTGKEQAAA